MFCMGLMMCLLFIQVISRYVFGYSLAFTEEISVILFILSVYIGAIGGTRRGQHLKIEIFDDLFKQKGSNCLSDSFRFGVHRGELLPELWKLPGGDKPAALRDADTHHETPQVDSLCGHSPCAGFDFHPLDSGYRDPDQKTEKRRVGV